MLRRRCRTTLAPLLQPPPWHSHRQSPSQRSRWRASSSSCDITTTTEEATTTTKDHKYAFLEHLPPQFLRRSHAGNVDPLTAQRTDVRYDPRTGKPTTATAGGIEQRPRATQPPSRLAIVHIRPRVVPTTSTTNTRQPKNDTTSETTTATAITIVWNDGRETEHPNVAVLERHYHAWTRQGHPHQQPQQQQNKQDQRRPWTHVTEAMVRRTTTTTPKNNNSSNSSNTTTATSSVALSMSFRDLMYDTNTNTNTTSTGSGSGTGTGMQQALHVLYKYGILLVTDTPTDDEGAGIAALVRT